MKKQVSYKRMVITSLISAFVAILLVITLIILLMGRLAPAYFKIAEIDALVRSQYINDVSLDELDDALSNEYLSVLQDDYAAYYSVEEANKKFDSFGGNKAGMGISIIVSPQSNSFYIKRVMDGSPAAIAELKAGDSIVAVGDIKINSENYEECYDMLLGNVGDEIDITILRNGKELNKKIVLDNYVIQSVFSEKIGDYGYIEITTFNDRTVEQFINCVDDFIKNGAKGLIFDLSDNSGGTLDSVIGMVDYIAPEGDIVSVEYNDGKRKVIARSDEKEINIPMAVIISNSTASAAELFAASIRDFEKGIVIGETSYGKGVMQTTYRLHDKSAVRFTVAKYFSKSGVSYNNIGIVPDIEVKLTNKERYELNFTELKDNPNIIKAVEYLNEK